MLVRAIGERRGRGLAHRAVDPDGPPIADRGGASDAARVCVAVPETDVATPSGVPRPASPSPLTLRRTRKRTLVVGLSLPGRHRQLQVFPLRAGRKPPCVRVVAIETDCRVERNQPSIGWTYVNACLLDRADVERYASILHYDDAEQIDSRGSDALDAGSNQISRGSRPLRRWSCERLKTRRTARLFVLDRVRPPSIRIFGSITVSGTTRSSIFSGSLAQAVGWPGTESRPLPRRRRLLRESGRRTRERQLVSG